MARHHFYNLEIVSGLPLLSVYVHLGGLFLHALSLKVNALLKAGLIAPHEIGAFDGVKMDGLLMKLDLIGFKKSLFLQHLLVRRENTAF